VWRGCEAADPATPAIGPPLVACIVLEALPMNPMRLHRSSLLIPLLGLACLALTAGCTVEERTVVHQPRPRDRVEVVTARPSERHVWVAGRWEGRQGSREPWEWVGGRWEIR
jgi:hypothetical protein